MYKPLPNFLTIRNSNIEGLGIFFTEDIEKDTMIGVTHIELTDGFSKELIRTPLGGFYNHSNNPNCVKVKLNNQYILYTLKDVKKNDELTVKYTFYKIK